jgi:hypothetical protein
MKKLNFLLLTVFTVVFFSCDESDSDENKPSNRNKPSEPVLVSYDLSTNYSYRMYQDDEPLDSLYSLWRKHEIAKILRVKPLDSKTIEVANFAPIDLEDVTITMKFSGHQYEISLFKIDKIPAHAVKRMEYPFINGESLYTDVTNNTVDLSAYAETGLSATDVVFDFNGENEAVTMLKSLSKVKWNVWYHDYNPDNVSTTNWVEDYTAEDVRIFQGYLINMAYMFSLPSFEEQFLLESIYENDGVTLMDTQRKQEVYNQIINQENYKCGVVRNVSGLGGGGTFGLGPNQLRNHTVSGKGPWESGPHETGHKLGFNHSSTMTYPKDSQGFTALSVRYGKKMLEDGVKFPVRSDNYYKMEDFN